MMFFKDVFGVKNVKKCNVKKCEKTSILSIFVKIYMTFNFDHDLNFMQIICKLVGDVMNKLC